MKITTRQIINKEEYTLDDLREKCIDFLENNGMHRHSAEKFITKEEDYIVFKCNCANSDYTRALTMLQLIISVNDIPGVYVSYRPEYSFSICVLRMVEIKDVIDIIDNNFHFKIETS